MLVILTEVRVCQGFRRKHVDRGVNSHLLDESKNKFNKQSYYFAVKRSKNQNNGHPRIQATLIGFKNYVVLVQIQFGF